MTKTTNKCTKKVIHHKIKVDYSFIIHKILRPSSDRYLLESAAIMAIRAAPR